MKVLTSESEVELSDTEAFRAFYEEALPRVYTYFFHRCGGKTQIAEDLTQETFLAVVSEMKKQRIVARPVAWVLGIARHKLLDHYRRQKRGEREVTMPFADQRGDDQLAWAREDWREQTLVALGAVPASQRAALVLRYLDGMSVAEVARAIGRSVRATESVLARGRDSFRRLYLEAGNENE